MLSAFFGMRNLNYSLDPEQSVAIGAAIYGAASLSDDKIIIEEQPIEESEDEIVEKMNDINGLIGDNFKLVKRKD